MGRNLFRSEVLRARQSSPLGTILIGRPLSSKLLAGFSFCVLAGFALFLIFGKYTKRARLAGHLAPDKGLVKVYPPQSGRVLQVNATDGQSVSKGDALFVLVAPREARSGDVDANVLARLLERRDSLRNERERIERIGRVRRAELAQRAEALKQELVQSNRAVSLQETRAHHAQAAAESLRALLPPGVVSTSQVQESEDAWIDQQARVAASMRTRSGLIKDLHDVDAELQVQPLTLGSQTSALDRQISELEQAIEQARGQHEMFIRAPVSGVVSGVMSKPGQLVQSAAPLLSIVPAGCRLEAHLYAPSRSIGLIAAGQKVQVRFQAFPFQKFGQYPGTVRAVSRTALQPDEVPVRLPELTASGAEQLYVVIVSLGAQSVRLDHGQEALQPDMLVEADVIQERRRLIEWIFAPVLGLARRI